MQNLKFVYWFSFILEPNTVTGSMALQWGALCVQVAQKAVLLVSSTMLVLQVYLSILEYQKHEYVQVPEESSLSQVDLPMITVCHENPYKTNVTSLLFIGADINTRQFLGWARDNMTTMDYLESLVTNEIENTSSVEIQISKKILTETEGRKLDLKKLRINYYDAQCFYVSLPQKQT